MHDECIRIPLRRRDGTVASYALIDRQDAQLAEFAWCLHPTGYAVRNSQSADGGTRRTIRLHRVVAGLNPGDEREVDHLNGHKLDDRRANLRILSHAANQQNQPSNADAMSRYRGVSWYGRYACWRARVRLNGKEHWLGYFDTEEAAAAVASEFRRAHMPFANEGRSGLPATDPVAEDVVRAVAAGAENEARDTYGDRVVDSAIGRVLREDGWQ